MKLEKVATELCCSVVSVDYGVFVVFALGFFGLYCIMR